MPSFKARDVARCNGHSAQVDFHNGGRAAQHNHTALLTQLPAQTWPSQHLTEQHCSTEVLRAVWAAQKASADLHRPPHLLLVGHKGANKKQKKAKKYLHRKVKYKTADK